MSDAPLLTVLCGGLGGARLAAGLEEAGLASRATFVTNVGDDVEVDGLRVCPDTDAVLYSLAGIFDEERGWGVRGDVFLPVEEAHMASWFSIGEEDRRLHARRAELLRAGLGLGEVTLRLASELGVASTVLPVTEDLLRTRVRVGESWFGFQEWLVRDHAMPTPRQVRYEGAAVAHATEGVLDAIRDAEAVVISSSSPVASVLPILEVRGVREALSARSGPVVAVSPVAQRLPLELQRDRRRAFAREQLLGARGIPHTPVAVAALYADVVDAFVLDPADAQDLEAVEGLGLSSVICPVTGSTREERSRLVGELVGLAAEMPGSTAPRIVANTRLSI